MKKTSKLVEIFDKFDINIDEFRENNDNEIKDIYKKISFSEMYNGGKEQFKTTGTFLKAASSYLKEEELRVFKQIIFQYSKFKVIEKGLLTVKNGYMLHVKFKRTLSDNEFLVRRVLPSEDTIQNSLVKTENGFAFTIFTTRFEYKNVVDIQKLRTAKSFWEILNKLINEPVRVYSINLSCEPIEKKWSVLKYEDKEELLLALSESYSPKRYIDVSDNVIIVFEYSDYLRNLPKTTKIMHNFRDIVKLNNIFEMEDINCYSQCKLITTNKVTCI